MSNDNKWDRLEGRPPPLFWGEKEQDFVKQINDEYMERVIGQALVYYPIDMESTKFHPLYGEAINKTFLKPLHIYALIEWVDNPTETTQYGPDNTGDITIHFHRRRLTEDQNLFVRVGDFIAYDNNFFEIIQTSEPKLLWGQGSQKFEIMAKCIKARQDVFDAE